MNQFCVQSSRLDLSHTHSSKLCSTYYISSIFHFANPFWLCKINPTAKTHRNKNYSVFLISLKCIQHHPHLVLFRDYFSFQCQATTSSEDILLAFYSKIDPTQKTIHLYFPVFLPYYSVGFCNSQERGPYMWYHAYWWFLAWLWLE